MKILHVVGTRPNFMKVAPIMAEMGCLPHRFQQILIHTGQHYDRNMSDIFFEDLELPPPAEFLGVGSGTHAEQTARVMLAFEPVVLRHQPDWVLVVGDVNSTLACALVCAKLGIRVAHVEAGLRSRDRAMPEEINRLLTDQVSDLLFTPSREATDNLVCEGIDEARIHFVGNVMIDTLVKMLPRATARPILRKMGLSLQQHVLVTLHRPSNVDDPNVLSELVQALAEISRYRPVVFPVHPRTRIRIQELGITLPRSALRLVEPMGYLDFLAVMQAAALVITDSGGVQEETTYLGVPCVTVRPNTERPVTIEVGTNRLVEGKYEAVVNIVKDEIGRHPKESSVPELWDGLAAKRIVGSLI
jgi:UDP-N-acetylglucosamine 2-epimerase (non-hydrolysing)